MPTGAFVARRNGQIFLTGNSGFPKATRIDTAIDKAANVEQEYVARIRVDSHAINGAHDRGWKNRSDNRYMTAPATDLAKTWAGHRYGRQALKPAFEFIAVAQVPYAGRPVDSIVQHGAGSLWIEGGRLGTSKNVPASVGQTRTRNGWGMQTPSEADSGFDPHSGRWPPNLALCHTPQCQRIGTKQVPGISGSGGLRQPGIMTERGGMFTPGHQQPVNHYAAPDGTETVAAWACSDDCPVAALDRQAGERGSRPGSTKVRGKTYVYHDSFAQEDSLSKYHGDTYNASRFFSTHDWALDVAEHLAETALMYYAGKASPRERNEGLAGTPFLDRAEYEGRNPHNNGKHRIENGVVTGPKADSSRTRNPHPCVKPLSLCRWLATLLLPPSAYAPRRLLVPFSGVASEMIGAFLAGWDEICGIEQDPTYVDIARQRLAHWQAKPRQEVLL